MAPRGRPAKITKLYLRKLVPGRVYWCPARSRYACVAIRTYTTGRRPIIGGYMVRVYFLLQWYSMQRMSVQWNHDCLSRSFTVSNGVRQGGVLSPFLFAVYLDSLLNELSLSGVGCCCRWMFAGVFCFADDIVLLAPCASALRKMLSICNSSHGLIFNSEKIQLICFRKNVRQSSVDHIEFNGVLLKFSNKVLHLGHLLSFDLSDKDDIIRATKDVNRKANLVLYTFRRADPFVLTFLYKMYCLSLYGCTLWSLSSTSLRCLQVAINKILRRIWHLPRNSHTSIVLNTARISYIHNIIMYRYSKFISRCLDSECFLLTLLYLTHSTLPTLLLVIIVCMVTLIPNLSLIMIHKQQIL